jgi:hypothetical protein
MSRQKGLGSPHVRGDGQPRPPPLTPKAVGSEIASGCGYLAVVILAIPVLIIVPILYFGGVDYIAGVLTGWAMGALEEPLILVLCGVAMIVLAAWGTYRVYRRRSLPEVTLLGVVLWGVVAVVLTSLGVLALVSAIMRTDTSGF